jgi:phosphinothricin acetyltransferase
MLTIRQATLDDIEAITNIYNEAIMTTVASFDTEPKTEADRRDWFAKHGPRRPILVAELNNKVVGWASLSDWSYHDAYASTVELSIYIKEESRHRGIGKRLFKALIEEGEKAGLHTIIARITEGNEGSVHLHESLGFEHIGVMREVGRKFGRMLDVQLMQKIYPDKPR